MFSFSLFFRIQGASPSSPSSTHCMHWLRRQICASRNPSGAGKSLQGTGRRRRSFARQPRAPHCERRASRGQAREAKRVGEAEEEFFPTERGSEQRRRREGGGAVQSSRGRRANAQETIFSREACEGTEHLCRRRSGHSERRKKVRKKNRKSVRCVTSARERPRKSEKAENREIIN
ncbi:hypothetical protein TGCAST_387780 [Toxoplasma gondii CAST]|uniref:Uncharacterized protein n=1 Tax=Toxoplasma gondii CAST TaxID=943122 RepID=A0A3R8GC01_TOXGO|nr:hypothetical protein TGCAST_387780 [Toxoplasma gondii CAST]